MENKAKNLQLELDSFLEKANNVEELTKCGTLLEVKRLQLGLKYLNENNIKPVNADGFGILAWYLEHAKIDSNEMKVAVHIAETSLLMSLNGAIDSLTVFAGESRKEKAEAKKKEAEILSVAGEILPDTLNGAYSIIQDGNGNSKIYDEKNYLIFDLEQFFEGVDKSAHKPAVVNNLPYVSRDAEANYRKVVKENAREFLMMLPAIEKEVGASIENVSDGRVPRPTVGVNTNVRKFRRENRPVDKNGNFLPSYLDYIKDDNTILTFSEFRNTPSAVTFNEFDNAEDYSRYVSSTAFWSYVSYLEKPLSEEAIEEGVESMSLEQNSAGEVRFAEGESGSDFVAPSEFVYKGEYPKEKIVLPKNAYKLAKKVKNDTVVISKVRDEKVINALNRVISGALSVVILANSLGWSVKQVVESIKQNEPNVEQGGDPPVKPVEPDKPDEPVKPAETDNVEVKEDPEEILPNPGEQIAPPEEETTEPSEEVTTPSEETTTPDETTSPEETTTPEETEDPSKDNPDVEVPDHNDVDEDRREENPDDEFWFE